MATSSPPHGQQGDTGTVRQPSVLLQNLFSRSTNTPSTMIVSPPQGSLGSPVAGPPSVRQSFPSYPEAKGARARVLKELKSVPNWIAMVSASLALIFGIQTWLAGNTGDDGTHKYENTTRNSEIWRHCMQFQSLQNTPTCRQAFDEQWGGIEMHQTERIRLAFFDKAQSHIRPQRNFPGSQINVDPLEGYSFIMSTSIISRTSLASVADYGTPLNIIRVFTCIEQPDWEVRLLLPLQEIFNFEGWPTPARDTWHPDSTSWQLSTRTGYDEINCIDNVEYFSIMYYCTNITFSLNLSGPRGSSHLNPLFNLYEIETGSCIEKAYNWLKFHKTRDPDIISHMGPFWDNFCLADENGKVKCQDLAVDVAVEVLHK